MQFSYSALQTKWGSIFLTLFFIALFPAITLANNLQITQVDLVDNASNLPYNNIKFDISWENSWRASSAPGNWDAVWVFAKFKVNTGNWQHATLNYVNGTAASDGHTEPGGATIETSSDGKGMFIYRASNGTGNISWSDAKVRWNYLADGVPYGSQVEIRVFGIEMVYIPQGAFTAGSGGTGDDEFTMTRINTGNSTQAPVSTGGTPGYEGGYPFGQTAPDFASWPNGFDAFYCMKYEMSESQVVSFFNTLTPAQKLVRDITGDQFTYKGKNTDMEVERNTVAWTSGDATTSAPDRACGFISLGDGLAYADWSGLRPFTDLEIEKLARGPVAPVADEFAWGTTNIFLWTNYILQDVGLPTETVTNPAASRGNSNIIGTNDNINGPVRCGLFAYAAPNQTREESGASYYGVMELSGNVAERCVTIAYPEGRRFTGSHGDGSLGVVISVSGQPTEGERTNIDWPNPSYAKGADLHGGSFVNGNDRATISNRYGIDQPHVWRLSWRGWRGVRTAP
ncbi:hypothetical protein N9933_02915 [bacterium]|nr:hypothetical protein [bacterium]